MQRKGKEWEWESEMEIFISSQNTKVEVRKKVCTFAFQTLVSV